MSAPHDDDECLCVECAHALRKENLELKRWIERLEFIVQCNELGANVSEPEQRRMS